METRKEKMQEASRSPYGERGLKLEYELCLLLQPSSLPLRGAWIEIDFQAATYSSKTVAPLTGSVD